MTKRISPDRKKQVETTRERHGLDHYSKIGALSSGGGFNNPQVARAAAMKRWAKQRKVKQDAISNEQTRSPEADV